MVTCGDLLTAQLRLTGHGGFLCHGKVDFPVLAVKEVNLVP